ncbi:AAA domain-containing protein, partial [Bacillus sp. D-CC]
MANQSFDWVIIDESARSISSELAIAMQSAKRILLVGDHKQLPPLY